jgi:hypothetical protein
MATRPDAQADQVLRTANSLVQVTVGARAPVAYAERAAH